MFQPAHTRAKIVSVRKNPDGSEIGFDANGKIVSTTDVLGEQREFATDSRSGKLMVKRFGLWTTPEQARVDDNGALYFRRGDMEIFERLDGVHIQANKAQGLTIKQDQINRTEVIEKNNGEVWKRETTDAGEHFWIWQDSVPRFKSDTYFQPVRITAKTPTGQQALSYVSRYEQSWERGAMVRERFNFNNDLSNERHVPVALQLGSSMLMLRQVTCVVTTFVNDEPVETTYELSVPTSLKIDVPMMKATFDDIKEVRSAQTKQGLCATFRKTDGTEQVLKLGVS